MNNYELNKVIDIHENATYLANGCIRSNYRKHKRGGYPIFNRTVNGRRKVWLIHRFLISLIDEKFNPQDTKQVVMHTCDNPSCISLEHIKLATQTDNMIDKAIKGRHHSSIKTHCLRGHELSGPNVRINRKGGRDCKICRNQAVIDCRARRKMQ